MDKAKFQATHQWVKDELKRSVDFWLKYGMDKEHGGVYTCIDRKGKIYSTDKSVWMQGRCGWIFAFLCTNYGKRDEWLEASRSCLDFLEEHCVNHEAGGRLYFTVTGDGKPLRQRRYCHSENFYTIANAEYYANTGDTVRIERARRAYEMVYNLNHGLIKDPTGLGPKTIPETRQSRAFGDPMIYLNVTAVMRRCDPENRELYDQRARECVDEIIKYHYKPELKCVLETVGVDGSLQTDTTAGRVVNPGHDIEGSWFLEEQANYEGDKTLSEIAQTIFHNAISAGWDEKYGGLHRGDRAVLRRRRWSRRRRNGSGRAFPAGCGPSGLPGCTTCRTAAGHPRSRLSHTGRSRCIWCGRFSAFLSPDGLPPPGRRTHSLSSRGDSGRQESGSPAERTAPPDCSTICSADGSLSERSSSGCPAHPQKSR